MIKEIPSLMDMINTYHNKEQKPQPEPEPKTIEELIRLIRGYDWEKDPETGKKKIVVSPNPEA